MNQQLHMTEPDGRLRICCPEHPDWSMMALEQAHYSRPVTLLVIDGQIEIDLSPKGEFMHDMEASSTVAYMCANPDCAFTIPADHLSDPSQFHQQEGVKPIDRPYARGGYIGAQGARDTTAKARKIADGEIITTPERAEALGLNVEAKKMREAKPEHRFLRAFGDA